MKNNNDLHGNRVVHGDSQGQTGTEQSQSFGEARAAKKEQEKKSAQEGVQKAGKTAGAAVGAYFGGAAGAKVGAKVGDAIGKSKIGQQLGKNLAKNPLTRKALSKANDSGALDVANKATDIATRDPKGGMGGVGSAGNTAANAAGSGSDSVLDKKPSKPNFLGNSKEDSSENKNPGSFQGLLSGNIVVKAGVLSFAAGILFIVVILMIVAQGSGVITSYDDAFGVSSATGGMTGDVDYESSDPKAQAFFDRVADVKNSFQTQGKTFDPVYISAVYVVLNQHGAKLSYDDMSTAVITEIANAMFSGNSFSEETFKQNLINTIFPKYLSGEDSDTYEVMADEVFDYYDSYFSLIGATASNCASLGSCVYEIKGFYIEGRGNVAKSMSITDLKVRLMQCGGSYGSGTWGEPLEGEELVPFEQYILGVAYQEIGPGAPDEAIKAQMVAARSFALARPTSMGNSLGKKLEQENGQWILQMSSCVADQVYCNPNLGCSAMNDGEQYGTVRSGVDHGKKFKDPMPADHKMRTLANETMGEVLVNDQGYVISANYASKIQNKFSELAKQGLNYKQILLQVYGNAQDIDKMSCNTGSGSGCNSTGSTGPYAGWKQGDPAWSTITIGNTNSTIGGVGCLVTSVSMLIAKSGVAVNVDGDFNPGTFVKKLNQVGGFQGANFVWGAVEKVAPNFQYVGKSYVSGQSQQQKLSTLQGLLDQGYYVVAEVKGNTGQHWVAIDGINGSTVLMMDPASQSTSMWQEYNWANTSQYAYFKVV
ncbi:MAG: SpoIID/LytB domain-containing protein [Candidatus Faecimonas sp.]|nr:SpoIID/LytB domain-containing protein [Mycoplasmatota bacterium]MDY2907550.1 SpoIID/LytB domain-containing protein [Candidatus Faecimonas sp.]